MPRLHCSTKDHVYTETEAAAALGVSVARLHEVLDEHIFTNGSPRPSAIHFTWSDLLLLGYWCNSQCTISHEVIMMPKRN